MSKKPKHKKNPPVGKFPRGVNRATQIANSEVAWHLRVIDKDGPWGWRQVDTQTIWDEIHSKMAAVESMRWYELLRDRIHEIPLEDLPSEARRRLSEINQEDIDKLVSLRITKISRIWGIRECNIFKILWWDPDHTVNPYSLPGT